MSSEFTTIKFESGALDPCSLPSISCSTALKKMAEGIGKAVSAPLRALQDFFYSFKSDRAVPPSSANLDRGRAGAPMMYPIGVEHPLDREEDGSVAFYTPNKGADALYPSMLIIPGTPTQRSPKRQDVPPSFKNPPLVAPEVISAAKELENAKRALDSMLKADESSVPSKGSTPLAVSAFGTYLTVDRAKYEKIQPQLTDQERQFFEDRLAALNVAYINLCN